MAREAATNVGVTARSSEPTVVGRDLVGKDIVGPDIIGHDMVGKDLLSPETEN